jgi:hypothetical protein
MPATAAAASNAAITVKAKFYSKSKVFSNNIKSINFQHHAFQLPQRTC